VINTQHKAPLNACKQLQWTSKVIQCVWDSEAEHWKVQNGNKHGHTTEQAGASTSDHKRSDPNTTPTTTQKQKDVPSLLKINQKNARKTLKLGQYNKAKSPLPPQGEQSSK
jgi:hypothetical protein